MRKSLVFVYVILLSACGKPKASESDTATDQTVETIIDTSTDTAVQNAAKTDTGTGTESTPFKFANVTEQEWKGKGDDVLQNVNLEAGGAIFHVVSKVTGYFSVELDDSNGKQVELLANETSATDHRAFAEIKKKGSYVLVVRSEDDWTISLVKPEIVESVPALIEGNQDTVTQIFPLKANKLRTVTAESTADGLFSIVAHDAATGEWVDLLANAIDGYKGETALTVRKDGYYLFEVKAEGVWSIKIK